MTAPVFVDTNVFVYASDNRETVKQPLAEEWLERLWREQSGRTSVQVLNECYWNLTRKIRPSCLRTTPGTSCTAFSNGIRRQSISMC